VLPANLDGLRDRAGDRDPWVELHNASDAVVDLSGLFLSSSVSNLTAWAFPPGSTLAPRQFLIVWCDGEPAESASGEWHTSFRLNPGEGTLTLSRNQAGAVVALDHLAYRDLPGGKAWGSVPDGQPLDRALFHLPTPGAANRLGAPPLLVFINEWMSSNAGLVLDPADGDPEDWFELYNAGPTPADLSAFTLTDVLTNATKFVIPNGTVIPPGGFLVVWADEETGQTTPEALHVNFKLSGAGEALGLFAPDGAPVDGLSFGVQDPSESQGRFPDGGDEPFVLMRLPTPGQANVLASANQPPVLASIGAKSVEEGTRLAFKATATDPDAGQTLRFNLLAAPEGALIDAVTGDFSWTPAEADGPSSITLTVRVTDNGTPARSDSESVTIQVREVNQVPVLDPIADRVVNEGEAVGLSAVARDADLPPQPIVYSLEAGAPAGATLDAASGEFRWVPTESQGPQVHVIGIRATDSATPAASVTRTFRVTVNEVNNAPEVDLVSLQTVEEGSLLSVPIVARDPDTPPAALQYLLESGPNGSSVESATGLFRWTPGELDGPGSYTVTVRVREGAAGLSTTTVFSVVVSEKNEPPQLAVIPDRTVFEGDVVAFTAVAQDTDLPAQKLTYRLEAGAPEGASLHPDSGVFHWAVPADRGASTHTLTVTVTDSDVAPKSASRTFRVQVEPRLRVVIHEIQYAPALANTEFVELYNVSSSTAWPIGGWRLSGLEFTFPAGTMLGATQHLVVARDLAAFRAAHGAAANALGNANLAFTATGPQRVRLERPSGSAWETVDEVVFERVAPWPSLANGTGASLQLIDAAQDNRRVGNWAAASGGTALTPRAVVAMTNEWRYFQTGAAPATWRDRTFNDTAWPSGRALLYVEDAALPVAKNTALTRTDGRMTYYFRTRFNFDGNPEGALLRLAHIVDDGVVLYLNGREIYRVGVDAVAPLADDTAANR
ncbi:MAG: lamin tail domain-containing protein, partial [Verrucomicrobiales bacterium]|nr:lamin tail domain-containing protein [Verrucomicrobiales bacterium]